MYTMASLSTIKTIKLDFRAQARHSFVIQSKLQGMVVREAVQDNTRKLWQDDHQVMPEIVTDVYIYPLPLKLQEYEQWITKRITWEVQFLIFNCS